MAYLDFLSSLHKQTSRDYLARVTDPEYPKARAARLAAEWGYDYWDGDRRTGYGGYRYDGRWQPVAQAMREHYRLSPGMRVLDVGCGKGFLLRELQQLGLEVVGLDTSAYALEQAHPEVKSRLLAGSAVELPFESGSFDLACSLNTLHNLPCYDLDRALRELERVGRHKYLCVESYRDPEEKANLLYWQLTCEMFCTPREWEWWFRHTGYTGDHSFIYFS